MLGIVLFAHGSRDARWREPMEAVARRVAEHNVSVVVSCAYLELMSPDLSTATKALLAQGATSIRVVPMFLGIGKHLREDLPKLLETLRHDHPEVTFTLDTPVGEQPSVIELLADIAGRPQAN
jgi:sirohydrochlorin cobaltochelatase